MKNFLYYLGEYHRNGCVDAGVELTPNRLSTRVPECSKQNDIAAAIFSGKNIVEEEITTYDGFHYKATVHAGGQSTEKEMESLKALLRRGLSELGINYRNCDLRKIPTQRDTDYEVTIVTM